MKPHLKPSTIIVLHSTAYYLLSYTIILVIFQLVTVMAARFFDIPAILHYNKIDFLVKPQSWTFDSVKMIFSSGCISALIIGLISLVIFLKAKTLEGLLKLVFFWGFIHGLNIFIGSIVIGAFIYEGMGYVFAWMYFNDTIRMFLLFIGLIILLGTGTLLTKSMLLTANTYFSSSRREMRGRFILDQFFLPYIFSTIILIAARWPLTIYELLLIITPGFLILPLLSGLHHFTIFFFDERERRIHLNKKVIFITLLVLVIFRSLLGYGLKIG
jgi:hypothetical protein